MTKFILGTKILKVQVNRVSMTRIYKSDPHGKQYKKISVSVMETAKRAVLVNKMSIRGAAKKYNIPYSVLQRHIKNKNLKQQGGQTVLTPQEEASITERLKICAEWGYPLNLMGLRLIIKTYLDSQGRTIKIFKENMPGREFAEGFLKRHKEQIAERFCQNIKRSRAATSPQIINDYFDNLEDSIRDIPPSHIINYDETNLCNDPGRSKIITKRGCKYPERIMNQTKSAVSVMFAASGDGVLLPCYVVYKAKHLYNTWLEGGPKGTRYNCTASGWFDSITFTDWVKTVAIPYLKKMDGEKVLIGDNLQSHLSLEAIELCMKYNIRFVFLPKNSTHLTQPLDVCFFRPLKAGWRKVLTKWKQGPGMKEASLPKTVFPSLLLKLYKEIETNSSNNIKSGFSKAGIIPLNRNQVLKMLPQDPQLDEENMERSVDGSFLHILRQMRYDETPKVVRKRQRVQVEAGKSIQFESENDEEIQDSESSMEVSLESDSADQNLPCSEEEEELTKETNSAVIADVPITVTKFGKTFQNVCVVKKENINVDDWLLVAFNVDNKNPGPSNKYLYYICKVIKTSSDEIQGRFLRKKTTTDFSSKIYIFPDVEDVSNFDFEEVIGKVDTPEILRRSQFKFTIDTNNL